jgi:hypothetical protein
VAAEDSPESEFQPSEILKVLEDEAVDYVVIGGIAAVPHGSTLPTQEIDILPLREPGNLDRLAGTAATTSVRHEAQQNRNQPPQRLKSQL